MKKIIICILFIITALAGCASNDFTYDNGYTDGVITESGWESEYFNLKFLLPENYTMISQKENNNGAVKTEMNAGYKFDDESGQRYGATVTIQIAQVLSGMSDEQIKQTQKESATQDGLTFVSEGDIMIAGENYSVIESRKVSDIGPMTVKRMDRRKNDKLITIIFMYVPENWDAKLETAFERLHN